MNPDIAYENFKIIHNDYLKADFNEADTRAKIIDRIFKQCLGWTEANINREEKVHTGFTDYQLKINNITRLVIEAKKVGEYFELSSSNRKRFYKMNGVIQTIPNLLKAINQVQNYSSDIGCRHSLVTNGYQFVLFTSITIGKPWRDSEVLVFHSLDDIEKNFSFFMNIFSLESIKKGSISSILEKNISNKLFKVVLNSLHNADEKWQRNILYPYIKPISDFVFSELIDNRKAEVLKECYIHERATKDLCNELDELFIDRVPQFSEQYSVHEIKDSKDDAGSFAKKINEVSFRSPTGDILVLLGGVGAGKSTFLYRYFRLLLPTTSKAIYFFTDFRTASIEISNIDSFIFETVKQTWIEQYSHSYQNTINIDSVSTIPIKDQVINLISQLKAINKSLVLVIDNVDQHTREYQESLFMIANNIKESLNIIVIVSLREETFMLSTRIGVFDAFHINKFHISSPNLLTLLKKRIDYSLTLLSKEVQTALDEGSRFKYEDDTREKLENYFLVLLHSLSKKNDQSKRVIRILDNVSCGDMRKALIMFTEFLHSGNTDVQNIIDMYNRSYYREYQISAHQLIKSIMLGEYRFFNDSRSMILNIFDFDITLTDSHFHRLRILKYLSEREHKKSPHHQKGYVSIDEIIILGDQVLISKEIISGALEKLSEYRLVEFDNLSKNDFDNASYVHITFSGKFYLRYLIHQFVYYDQIAISTPISDQELYHFILVNNSIADMNYRREKAMSFVEYLFESEKKEFKIHPEYVENDLTNCCFGDKICPIIKYEYEDIIKKAKERDTYSDAYESFRKEHDKTS